MWPSLSPEESEANATQAADEAASDAQTAAAQAGESAVAASSTNSGAPPILGTTVFEAPGVTPGEPTGTHVGKKIQELRGDLSRLQTRVTSHNNSLQSERARARGSAGAYHGLVGAMNTRLQVGTTPGNPIMVNQWNQAQRELEKVGDSIATLNSLSSEASSTSALAAFMLESTRATFELRGALEEDHRQLAVLEDEVNQTVVIIDRLLNELTDDVARSQNYFSGERANLTAMQVAIDNGEYIGGSLASRAFGVPAPPPQGGAAGLVGQRQPLVIIRFDRPDVAYEQALFTAVSRALERRPNSGFDLVSVAPGVGNPAQVALATNASRRNAEGVLRSLTNMGLAADRVSLSATSSPAARVSEVHVYVR
ncbi:hypothetical protein [Denitrobaculum tricleocarpae]|uniref:hypothetical protein n=1 Tax=Denitrobaculum tricleocarpae TaxID=2591009 RepID=UPI001FE7E52D|nr:hypothetical protein [Denitrobaculum tricleocarpae]